MKKKVFTCNGKYFYRMVINGHIIDINPNKNEWDKIFKKYLKNKKVVKSQYEMWLIFCMSTVLETNPSELKFENNFVGGLNGRQSICYPCPFECNVQLFYGEANNV